MSEPESSPGNDPTNAFRPPPVPQQNIVLTAGVSAVPPRLPQPRRPTNWKKVLLIVGIVCAAGLALTLLTLALLFGGCAYLVQKMGK